MTAFTTGEIAVVDQVVLELLPEKPTCVFDNGHAGAAARAADFPASRSRRWNAETASSYWNPQFHLAPRASSHRSASALLIRYGRARHPAQAARARAPARRLLPDVRTVGGAQSLGVFMRQRDVTFCRDIREMPTTRHTSAAECGTDRAGSKTRTRVSAGKSRGPSQSGSCVTMNP